MKKLLGWMLLISPTAGIFAAMVIHIPDVVIMMGIAFGGLTLMFLLIVITWFLLAVDVER